MILLFITTHVERLRYKYKTNDPFEVADNLDIIVLLEDLGIINGYYNTAYGQKFIHVNRNFPSHKQKFIAAHELGHAILHSVTNTAFMKNSTYFSTNKFEKEANQFAVHLIITDADLAEYEGFTISQLSQVFDLHESIIKLRFNK